MKRCTHCNQEKPLTDFNKNKGRSDGLNSYCRSCHNAHCRTYYLEHKVIQKKQISDASKLRHSENIKKFWNLLCISVCKDCGLKDPRVLEFDHLPGYDKSLDVSRMLTSTYSWKTIEIEISKCDIVCANCHRIRTQIRAGHFRAVLWSQ